MWTRKAFAIAALLALAVRADAADEIHWTHTGPTSVSFDWRGAETTVRYGLTPALGDSAIGVTPSPVPWSSAGPFREARLTGLRPDTLYHYSIGNGPLHTFRTPRTPGSSNFTVMVQADVGTVAKYWRMGVVQQQIAAERPAFVLMPGDLTYGNAHGPSYVDNHFNDVMPWSQDAAYYPTWGNHEYENGNYVDDLRNYKGRFDLPNPRTSPGSPSISCCGEDWYWFDYGNVRFIAYPEPWPGAWLDWVPKARALMDSAQADPNIAFIVTFGHRPAYSSGHHPGSPSLRNYLDQLGATHDKYKLNFNGHSHNYERTYPQSGVTHITAGGGGSNMEDDADSTGTCHWRGGCPAPAYSAFRAYRHGPVKLTFTPDAIQVRAICGPPGDGVNWPIDVSCAQGSVFDSVTIRVVIPESQIDQPASDVSIQPGQSVFFAGTGTDPDGDYPLQYRWDFAGGAPNSTLEDPGLVRFDTPGDYHVRFTVIDATGYGDPSPATRTVHVGPLNQPPSGTILEPATQTVTIEQGQSVMFRGSASDPDGDLPLTFVWNFDEGAPGSNVLEPGLVRFNDIGSFEVQFIVTDARGATDPTPASVQVTVIPPKLPPIATIASPAQDVTIQAGLAVNVQGTASDPDGRYPLAFEWNFSGGAPASNVEDPGNVTFATPGVYPITFTVTDAAGLSTTTPSRTVTVVANQPPNGVIDTPVADVTIQAGLPVMFASTGGDLDGNTPLTYAWTFGGGAPPSSVEDPGAVVFANPGTYSVTLTVRDARGLADPTPALRTVTVLANQPPNGFIDLPIIDATIQAGLSVTFAATGNDPDGNTPVTYAWNFGGGALNSSLEDPGAVYFANPGTYTVTMTVTDARGLADPTPATRTVTVVANQPPNGTIDTPSADVTTQAGLPVSFAATASDPDGNTPLTYAWNFGGGAPASGLEDPGAVVFANTGTYTVTFTVTDARGLADPTPATRTVTVVPNQAPNGFIDLPILDATIQAGLSVSFAASGSDPDGNTPLTYAWNFGGGASNSSIEDPGAVVFANPGTYPVTLTVTDARGLADPTPATRIITVVANQAPNGTIDAPSANASITAGGSVSFAATGSDPDGNTPLTYAWNFGGGASNSSFEDPGAVMFANPGTYTVTLTVSDSRGLADPTPATRTITVIPPNQAPNGTIDSPSANVSIQAGLSVTFASTGSDPDGNTPLSYAWNFGGGAANSTLEDPGAVVFANPGTYAVTLTVTDALGLADPTPATRTVTVVANQPPNGFIDLPIFEPTIQAGLSVTFAASASDPDGNTPLTYAWNFGGGAASSTLEDPGAVVFANPGTYTVTLTVTDARGLADPTPATRTVTVTAVPNQAPNGTIDAPVADVTIQAGLAVAFASTGSDPDGNTPLTYAWSFSGGAPASSVEDPGPIVFATPGTYPVTLTVTDSRGLADPTPATRTITVVANQAPNGTIDAPSSNVSIVAGGSVTFASTGSDPDGNLPLTYAWNFGGGAASSTLEDPGAVVFATPGTYTVMLTVSDSRGLADPTPATRTITVAAPNQAPNGVIDTPATNVTITTGGSVTFASTGTDPDGDTPLTYAWNFGGGAPSSSVEDPGAVAFANAGTFTVTLTVTDARGLADPTPSTRTITVVPPNQAPNGTIDTPSANVSITAGGSVTFTSTGTDPDGNLPLTYAWNFGGGAASSTLEDPGAVVFASAGTYTVTLTVTDGLGFADPTPATRTITVNATPANQPPNGTIDIPDRDVTMQAGLALLFASTGTDPDGNTPLTYAWNFSGGAPPSSAEDPGALLFMTPGTYTVTLTVTDALGLSDPTPATRTITVVPNQAPNGGIDTPTSDRTIQVGDAVSFSATGADPDNNLPLQYSWNFGGGAANSNLEDPGAITFNQAGTFNVTMTVRDGRGLADPTPATRIITVLPNQAPNGVIDQPAGNVTIMPGQSVTFAGSGSDPDGNVPLSYSWNFGGVVADSELEDPGARPFPHPGTYVVTLTVRDAKGLADPTPAQRTITVSSVNQMPIASLTITPATGNAPLMVTADAAASMDPDGSIATYFIDYGDGATSGTGPVSSWSHFYGPGSYVATVHVIDQLGGTSTATVNVLVAERPVVPNLVQNPSFERNLTGWGTYGGTPLVRVTGGFDSTYAVQVDGASSLEMFGINDSPNAVALTTASDVGQRYRFSAWVRSPSSTGRGQMWVREFKSGVKIGQTTVSPNVTLTPGWQLVSVEHTVQQSGSTLDLVVFDQPVAQNERLVIDNVSIRPPGATTGVEDLLAGATSFSTRVAPNPFRTRTRIAFTMPRPGRAKIEVVDLSGRLIRTLMDEAEISVGIHGVDFDGCDAQGARLPSGIYFYRVSSTAGSATQRFVLLK